MRSIIPLLLTVLSISTICFTAKSQITYPIVDTGQELYYGTVQEISSPAHGSIFYGQDACYDGNQLQYRIMVMDQNLKWQDSYKRNDLFAFNANQCEVSVTRFLIHK